MEDQISTLERAREEKLRQIGERRRQVEELKKRRAERDACQSARQVVEHELNRSVDSLIAEILSGAAAADGKPAAASSPLGPLRELKQRAAGVAEAPCPEDRAMRFEQVLGVAGITIDPESTEQYERCVQTDLTGDQLQGQGASRTEDAFAAFTRPKTLEHTPSPGTVEDVKRPQLKHAASKCVAHAQGKQAKEEGKRKLTPEERERIERHPDYQAFFARTTLLVERTLGMRAFDQTELSSSEESGEEEESAGHQDLLKQSDDYTNVRWTNSRPVTDVRFSPHSNMMFLSAHGRREHAKLSDPDGCVLVWNVAMRNRPELIFSSASQVLTARFHRHEPALFWGGTYSGGLVLWDARARTTPVMVQPVTVRGHAHPVQSLEQLGTQNASTLVSASSDGRLCTWSMAKMDVPQETLDLKHEARRPGRQTATISTAVMSMAFQEKETNSLYVGAEDGATCQVHIRGAKPGVIDQFEGHEGPVTAIDMHPLSQQEASATTAQNAALFELAVTCSFDWSVKLWMVKQFNSPVLSLDVYDDYVYDVKWHPQHPGVFAAVDGEGHVDLWNINRSLEAPVTRYEPPESRRLAVNRCGFSGDGRRLVTGSSEGLVSVFSVDKSITRPSNEDFKQYFDVARGFRPAAGGGAPGSAGGGDIDRKARG